mgnify:CR=1 FL=1
MSAQGTESSSRDEAAVLVLLRARHRHVLKAAATTVVAQPNSPLQADYRRLLDGGTKPNLAKLTIARRLAAIALAMWKRGEEYDPKKNSQLVS